MFRRLLAGLFILVVLSGCDAAWLPITEIKVDPAAIGEVRSVGRVVTRTFADPIYERTVQVIEILVIDVEASSLAEAAKTVRGRLEQQGWSTVGPTDLPIQMESSRWKGTTARLGHVEEIGSLGARLEPSAEKARQADPAKWGSYVVVSLSSVGE